MCTAAWTGVGPGSASVAHCADYVATTTDTTDHTSQYGGRGLWGALHPPPKRPWSVHVYGLCPDANCTRTCVHPCAWTPVPSSAPGHLCPDPHLDLRPDPPADLNCARTHLPTASRPAPGPRPGSAARRGLRPMLGPACGLRPDSCPGPRPHPHPDPHPCSDPDLDPRPV